MLVREHAHFGTFIATLMIKPIPAGGGVVSLTPPLAVFGDNSKSIGLRLFKLFDFFN